MFCSLEQSVQYLALLARVSHDLSQLFVFLFTQTRRCFRLRTNWRYLVTPEFAVLGGYRIVSHTGLAQSCSPTGSIQKHRLHRSAPGCVPSVPRCRGQLWVAGQRAARPGPSRAPPHTAGLRAEAAAANGAAAPVPAPRDSQNPGSPKGEPQAASPRIPSRLRCHKRQETGGLTGEDPERVGKAALPG